MSTVTAQTRLTLTHDAAPIHMSFINAMKDLTEKYYITINDVNGGNDDKLAKARQDAPELPGQTVVQLSPGRMQVAMVI